MNYIKYPSNEAVEAAVRDKDPMLMLRYPLMEKPSL